MTATRQLAVPEGLAGERVDAGVARLFGLSRTQAADLATDGRIAIDGAPARKSDRLATDAWLTVELDEPSQPASAPAPTPVAGMRIAWDDPDVVVVDKPVGVAAHSGVGWSGPTVVGALAAAGYRISTSGAPERQGVVQRLDVGTSGLMMVAKSERAYTVLKQAFRDRAVHKVYHALVHGHPDPLSGTIDAPIGRHPGADFKFAVRTAGKRAVTHYEVIEALRGFALAEVRLETGRTHQIRVHFAALRHPIVGDPMYGSDPTVAARLGLERQWLHAVGLGFAHPVTGEWVEVASPYPDDLALALTRLRAEDGR